MKRTLGGLGCGEFPLLLALLGAVGCGKSDDAGATRSASRGSFAEPCVEGTDCSGELVCVEAGAAAGLCSVPCESTGECTGEFGASARCEDSNCVLGCQSDGDCPASSSCDTITGNCSLPVPTDPEPSGEGVEQPTTTNTIIEVLRQSAVGRLDLLFVIDNSIFMGEKQALFAEAVPDLVNRFVDPVCRGPAGDAQPASNGQCSAGFEREFQPIDDLHVAVITTSLGGFGSELDCIDPDRGQTDHAHLLGSLTRVRNELPTTPEFLAWCPPDSNSELNGECVATAETSNGDATGFSAVFADQVRAAGARGCGWEAPLESWLRFLVDPYPWTRVVRQNCPFGGDTNQLCVGPETDAATGLPFIDDVLIQQRQRFLRADSVLGIVMLTDENDCSFKASGQTWRLSETYHTDATGNVAPNRAYRASAVCQEDPNSPCCVSCGSGVPSGCPTGMDASLNQVNAGCEEPVYESADDLAQQGSSQPSDDPPNLRCFDHKRRFGVDYLYPVERYSNALSQGSICPFAESLLADAMAADGSITCGLAQEFVVPNPLYMDLSYDARRAVDPNAEIIVPRDASQVFLAGLVGVPWQDLAVDPAAVTLEYRSNASDAEQRIDWVRVLGSADVGAPYDVRNTPPGDPLMWEQIDARPGVDASINGGDWNILDRDDLQYACTFPLSAPIVCPDISELELSDAVSCECTFFGDPEYANPLCDGLTQTHDRAFPGIRQLQVLRDYGPTSIVASACPKNTTDPNAADYGYRPAVSALVERMKTGLRDSCLPRSLPVSEGGVNCMIIEANPRALGCDAAEARTDVQGALGESVRRELERIGACESDSCAAQNLCAIEPLDPGTADFDSCLNQANPTGDGWCYVDPEQGLGDASQVGTCPDDQKRRIRFAGAAAPKRGTVTVLACQG